MNKAIHIALTCLGGFVFFGISFMGFARMAGVPLHKVAVIGPILIPLLGLEPPPDTPAEPQAPVARDFGSAQEVVRASVGALGAFTLPAPFQRDELQKLSDELKARRADTEQRAATLQTREQELAEQLARLEHMSLDLARMRADFDARESALELRAQEVARDEGAKRDQDAARWGKLGQLLVGLEPKEAGTRIQQHTPQDAALILSSMDPAKAAQILGTLPKEAWAVFSSAYAEAAPAPVKAPR